MTCATLVNANGYMLNVTYSVRYLVYTLYNLYHMDPLINLEVSLISALSLLSISWKPIPKHLLYVAILHL